MVTEVCFTAPAKINFGLRVLPKREDGFHTIESIFQTVTLSDQLTVSVTGEKGYCDVSCSGMKLPENNTLTSSYHAFCSVIGSELPGIRVELVKGIPAGGGLGGGSSDAASFIRALEKVCGIALSEHQIREAASLVGSDVFFFLLCGTEGCACVTGRGEVVQPIHARNDLYIVLVFPEVKSPTREAYELLDGFFAEGNTVACPAFADLETVYSSPVCTWKFANSFTPSLAGRYPEIAQALDDIRKTGAAYAEMSGSGSTVYGVFPSLREAENARCVLAERWKCAVVRPSCGR